MSGIPYRIRDIATPSLPRVETLAGGVFLKPPRFGELRCIDMYGDLPYGLFVLPNASVRGHAGYLYSGDSPILEQNADFLRNGKFLRPRFNEIQSASSGPREVEELVSLKSRCHQYFWHWIMDSLPKVFLAESSGFTGTYLLPSTTAAPWATESLHLVGVHPDRILYADSQDINAKRLYLPTYFCGYNAEANSEFVLAFRRWVRERISSTSAERLFIARRSPGKARRIINQELLEAFLTKRGFTTVYFEDLSLKDQLSRVCSADALVGSHGSGLTHSLFMKEGSLIVELFPFQRRQTNDCYEVISRIVGHHYHAVESVRDCESDIEVIPDAVWALLSRKPCNPAAK